MSNLVDHARVELQRAGLFDEDSDYGGMLGEAVLELVEKFASQGHSGFSAAMTVELAQKLMKFEPLTPLTGEDDEWMEVGEGVYQNIRYSSVFKDADNDGKAYDINALVGVDPSGGTWMVTHPRTYIEFPYTPERREVKMDAHGRGLDGETIIEGFCDDDGCKCWHDGDKLQLEGDEIDQASADLDHQAVKNHEVGGPGWSVADLD